jgi:signal transduction histidine kinase
MVATRRIFLFWGGVLFAVATFVLVQVQTSYLRRELTLDAERHARIVAAHLSNTYLSRYGWDLGFLSDPVQREEFDRRLRPVLGSLQVEKIKIYTPDETIVYATDADLIGREIHGNASLISTLRGASSTHLADPKYYFNVYGQKLLGTLIETYVPLRDDTGKIIGAFEIYQDNAPLQATIRSSSGRLILVMLVFMFSLAGLVILFVVNQNRALLRQKDLLLKELEAEVALKSEQLISAAKLATMGMLASKVGHEIRNALNEVVGYGSMIKGKLSGREAEYFKAMSAGVARVEGIARDLLVMGSHSRPVFQEVEVAAQIDEVVRFFRDLHRGDCASVVTTYRSRGRIRGIPDRLRQVFMNLLQNSCHAMEEARKTGTISVTVSDTDDGRVKVEISDDGPGIPPKVINRIFDPFFTTKPEGKGTGLGLPVVKEIIENHGGTIDVFSVPGSGATFTILFPAAKNGKKVPQETVLN